MIVVVRVSNCVADELYSEQEKYFDYRNDLHRVTAKTLIIVGDQDWICPPSKILRASSNR